MARSYFKKKNSAFAAPPSSAAPADAALSVTELAQRIVRLLEEGIGAVRVEGEISNYRLASSGHAYFVLKDENSSINCVCFRSVFARLNCTLGDGKQVEVRGRVSAYAPRSEYQIIVETVREAGIGDLMRKFMELRDKLKAEGLFDAGRKRPLPHLPRSVGVVTSPTGAAVRDILNVLSRRGAGLNIIVSPCAVQGASAPGQIIHALRRLERDGRAEVIIVARGGGSIEDLWAFNDERVVRAIAICKIPTICGVGHETDTTLSDYAADLRAPTPSAAAEIVTANYIEFCNKIEAASEQLIRLMQRQLRARRAALQSLAGSWGMRRPIEQLNASLQKLDDLRERLERANPRKRIEAARERLAHLASRLDALHPEALFRPRIELARSTRAQLSRRLDLAMKRRLGDSAMRLAAVRNQLHSLGPESVLRRGFSIITTKGRRKIITGPGQAKIGDTLRVQSAGGEWRVTPLPEGDELFDQLP